MWFRKPGRTVIEVVERDPYENSYRTYVLQKPTREGMDELWRNADKYKKDYILYDTKNNFNDEKDQVYFENIPEYEEKYPIYQEDVFLETKLNPQVASEPILQIEKDVYIPREEESRLYSEKFRHFTDATKSSKNKAKVAPKYNGGKSFTRGVKTRVR
jgi:hypothetical protein